MRSRPTLVLFLLLVLASLHENLFARNQPGFIRVFNIAYHGQVLTQRHFYSGTHLVYDLNGNLFNRGTVGNWTLDAMVAVESLSEGHGRFILNGRRMYVAFVDKKERFYWAGPVEIDMVSQGQPLTFSSLKQAFSRIFLGRNEHLSQFAPSYWSRFLSSREHFGYTNFRKLLPFPNIPGPTIPYEKIVMPPKPVSKPAANYDTVSLQLHFEGTDVFRITIDRNGRVSRVMIVKPVGLGLDDQAVKTLRKWRFHPATVAGKPVPFQVFVEDSFKFPR